MPIKARTCKICKASFIPKRDELFCNDCLINPHHFVEDDVIAAEYLKDARKDILESTEILAREDL